AGRCACKAPARIKDREGSIMTKFRNRDRRVRLLPGLGGKVAVLFPERLLVELPHTRFEKCINKDDLVRDAELGDRSGIGGGFQMRLYLRGGEIDRKSTR